MRKGPWCWYLALGFTFLVLLFYRVPGTLAQTPFPEWAKGFGPLPIRNQSPIQLLFFQFTPEGAKPLEKGKIFLRLGLAETNTLVSDRSSYFSGTIDMEMSYLGLNIQYGLMKGAQVGIELPFIYTHSGIMDSFIAEVEDFFGKQRGIRTREDRFEFDYSVMRNGEVFISGRRGGAGIGDLALTFKREILKEDSFFPALSVRLGGKAPTGYVGSAFGSGKPDFGLGLALEKHFGKWAFYTNTNLTFPVGRFHGKTVEPIFSGLISAEYNWTSRFSLVAQFSGITPPFHGTGISFLGRRVFDLTGGFSLLIDKDVLLQGGMIEDIISSTEAGSDVTFFLIVSKIWD